MKFNIIKLLIFLSVILLIAIYLIYYMFNHEIINDSENKIKFEIIKSLLDVVTVAIVGGIVSLIFKAYENSIEKSKLRVESKVDFMRRLGELYRTIKSSRRKLIANGLQNKMPEFIILITNEQIKFYHKEMEIVNNVQLELEGLVVAVQNYNLFNYSSEISLNLKNMEKYLRDLLEEYEDNYLLLKSSESSSIEKLNKLKEFTSNNKLAEKNEFKNKFSKSYFKILLHLN